MGRSVVSVMKTTPETVVRDIEQLAVNAEMEKALPKDATTILKDNISWHLPYLSANTTPWQLEGTICALKKAGYNRLLAIHNDTIVTNAYKGGRLNKLEPLYRKHQIPEKYNFVPDEVKWVRYEPKAPMLALDRIFPAGIFIPECFIGANIIHLPTVKTHVYTTTTGSMKNAFGGLLNTKRHYAHTWIHEALVDLLAIQKEIHTGLFTVMDGTLCGNGPGPRTMTPVEKDYMLAGADCVAIDAVAAKMMGFEPMSIPYLRLAHERGLGTASPADIEIVGEDISSVDFGFTVGNNMASRVGNQTWFGPCRSLQKLFFHTPVVYIFVLGSFLYHDYIWWPMKGRPIQKDIAKNTKWGRLFCQYPGA